MANEEIERLKQEIAALKEKIALIEERADFDRDAQLKFVLDRFREMDQYIFPTFYKVFPDFAKADAQIDRVIGWQPEKMLHSYGKDGKGKEIL